jgi:hypothetical protein
MGQSTRSLSDLILLSRTYLDQIAAGPIQDSSATQLDLTSAVQFGYERVAKDAKCIPVSYTEASTADQSVYEFSAFGESSAGARMFDLRCVFYNQQTLEEVTTEELDARYPNWRFDASGTPRYWIRYGEQQIKLYPTPSGTSNIYIEGWETPDLSLFSESAHEPKIHVADRHLIAIQAAFIFLERLIDGDGNGERIQALASMYGNGINEMRKRLVGTSKVSQFASGASEMPYWNQFGPITMISS